MEMNSILTELRLLKLSDFKQLLHDRMWGLYNHLLAQFSMDRFQILHTFGKYIEDMYVKISISSLFYLIILKGRRGSQQSLSILSRFQLP